MKKAYEDDCPDYLMEFLTNLKVVKNRGERTVEAYYIDLRTFLRYLKIRHGDVDPNKTPWENIKIEDVPAEYLKKFTLLNGYEYLNWLVDERQNTPRTRARKTAAMKQFFNFLTDRKGLMAVNPILKIELPKVTNDLPKFLTLNQAQDLLSSIDSDYYERDYCIITLFLNCGMRLSELCGLSMSDISFENETLRLFGKGRKERIVYMNDACISAMKDYLEVRKPADDTEKALFLSRRGTRLSRRRTQEIVENSLKSAGLSNLGISTHKLRHTAATLMYQYGEVEPMVIKEVLGHKSISTTEIYVHLSNKSVLEAAEANPLSNYKPKKRKKKTEDNNDK